MPLSFIVGQFYGRRGSPRPWRVRVMIATGTRGVPLTADRPAVRFMEALRITSVTGQSLSALPVLRDVRPGKYHDLVYHDLVYHDLVYHDLVYHDLMYHDEVLAAIARCINLHHATRYSDRGSLFTCTARCDGHNGRATVSAERAPTLC
ncbi:unnamed protein product, partial [Iphiclides podalirius]